MKQLVIGQDEVVGPWVSWLTGGMWTPQRGTTIGLAEDGKLIAGVLYEDFNKTNIAAHIAGLPDKKWMCRMFLWAMFDYPFNQLKVKRITGVVAASNLAARRFDEHLGFTLEATLKDAHPDGDLLIYCMRREQCRWLSLGKRYEQSSTSSRSDICTADRALAA